MIYYVIECSFLGIVAAFTSIFYNYTLQNDSIFCKLGNLLDRWSESDGFKGWISNPLGACIYCNSTWITILTMVLYCIHEKISDITIIIISFLAAIGIQHIIIKIFVGLENKE